MSPSAVQAALDWNGVWVGKASNGRVTEISISKNKVVYWKSNGQKAAIATSEVGKNSVTIKHVEGATVTLVPGKGDTLVYTWRGRGGTSKVVLARKK